MSLQSRLYDAIKENNEAEVRHLLREGAPMIVELFARAARNRSLGILDVFIENGWDINTPQGPFTPSPIIEILEDRPCLEWFLKHGADINKRCFRRNITPLSWAVRGAPMDVVNFLFEHGGDVTRGQLLHYACLREGLDEDDNSELLQYIYNKDPASKAKINKILDEDDEENFAIYYKSGLATPLHYAVSVGSRSSVEFLLQKGADSSIKEPYGYTPLETALQYGHEKIVPLLRPSRM